MCHCLPRVGKGFPRMAAVSRNIIVIGGSAGALSALTAITASLPRRFGAAVFVVIHTSPDAAGALDRVLARTASLPVTYASDGTFIQPGTINLAPPDRHLLLKRRVMRVTSGPRENHFRPAVDPLFRTAA